MKVSGFSNPYAVIPFDNDFTLTTYSGGVIDAVVFEDAEGLELQPASFVSTTLVTPIDPSTEIVVGGTQGYAFKIVQSIGTRGRPGYMQIIVPMELQILEDASCEASMKTSQKLKPYKTEHIKKTWPCQVYAPAGLMLVFFEDPVDLAN